MSWKKLAKRAPEVPKQTPVGDKRVLISWRVHDEPLGLDYCK